MGGRRGAEPDGHARVHGPGLVLQIPRLRQGLCLHGRYITPPPPPHTHTHTHTHTPPPPPPPPPPPSHARSSGTCERVEPLPRHHSARGQLLCRRHHQPSPPRKQALCAGKNWGRSAPSGLGVAAHDLLRTAQPTGSSPINRSGHLRPFRACPRPLSKGACGRTPSSATPTTHPPRARSLLSDAAVCATGVRKHCRKQHAEWLANLDEVTHSTKDRNRSCAPPSPEPPSPTRPVEPNG